MDETTQQNAALVEETTSAAQSMKDQAQELMRQVEVFKIAQSEGHHAARASVSQASPGPAVKPVTKPAVGKVAVKKPVAGKSVEHKQPAGVAAGNGKDRHSSGDDFEEF